MPHFPFIDFEAEAEKAKLYWAQFCDQFYLLDGDPYHTGPEWIYVEIQGEAPDHNLPCWPFEDKTLDNGFLYLPCLNLRTGETIHVRMNQWPQRSYQEATQYSEGSRFRTVELIENEMEVLAWASL